MQYGLGDTDYSLSRRNQFTGTVDLDNQTISYSNKVIDYESIDDSVTILNNESELLDETFVRMVHSAEDTYKENKEMNTQLLLSAGWLPIVTAFIGLMAWLNPRLVWYVEGGYRYKDAEPSSTSLTIIKGQALVAFGLTVLFVWLLVQRMV